MEHKSISSTFRRSPAPDLAWPERRHWLVAIAFGLALVIFLVWVTLAGSGTPEIRMAATSRAISAQIVDGEHRILVLNAHGPRDARAVIGKLSQPWEPRPSTVIVGADRDNASALWEALHRLKPRQVIVAGAPGDSAEWSAIERYARVNAIQISYLERATVIDLATLTMTVSPPVDAATVSNPSYLEIGQQDSIAVIELAGLPRSGRYHMAISAQPPGPGIWSNLAVRMPGSPASGVGRSILLRPGDQIEAAVEPERFRIRGRAAQNLQPD